MAGHVQGRFRMFLSLLHDLALVAEMVIPTSVATR